MKRNWILIVISVLLLSFFTVTNASAATIITAKYDDFTDLSQFTLNGNTVKSDVYVDGKNVLRLTPAAGNQSGSAFLTKRVSLTNQRSFSAYFSFQMNNPGGAGPADGLAFVVQTNANNLGSNGGGIGYAGINPSLAIEFDTWQNTEYSDPNYHHVGINLNGNLKSLATAPTGNLLNAPWYAWVDYNGNSKTIEVRMSHNNSRPGTPTLTYNNLDLQSILNMDEVYVGFTAATGAGWENHDIRSFYFNNDYAPIDPSNTYTEAPTNVSVSADIVNGTKLQDRTISALVKDKNNQVVPNTQVTFTTSLGTITSTAMTDANGVATATLTSQELGTAHVKAMAVGGAYGEMDIQFSNQAPVANNVVASSVEDTGNVVRTFSVTDQDNDPLTYELVDGPQTGSVELNGNQFTYTPEANQNGDVTFTYKVNDGTEYSNIATVTVSIAPVNDAPSFVKGKDLVVNKSHAGKLFSLEGWATSISPGPANESDQHLQFMVSNDQNGLFDVQPAIDPNGKLTFTPKDNVTGTATVSVQLKDNGGTENGGTDTSDVQTFKILVDTTAPTVNLSLNHTTLWPPNHKMVLINANVDPGNQNDIASVILTSITSNEPDFAPVLVDGDAPNDIETGVIGTDATSFHLRAERSGKGNGRVYTVTYTVTDLVGNATTASAQVFVPHDNSSK